MIRTKKKLFANSEFAHNAIKLTIGTTFAQVLPFLFYPILSRIFNPEDFGLFATISSITQILAVISTGKYDFSILIVNNNKEAAHIISIIMIISLLFLSISFIILQIFSNTLSLWLNNADITKWLYICPIAAFQIIIFNCYNEWSVRNKSFTNLAWNKIINAGSIASSKLFLGLINFTSSGLIVGDFFGRILTSSVCVYKLFKTYRVYFFDLDLKNMRILLSKYSNFPKYLLPGQILNTVGAQLPIFLLGFFYNKTEVGYFSMTMLVLSTPISVISTALKDIFRQRANEDFNKNGECRTLYIKLLKLLIIPTAIMTLILIIVLPKLLLLFLGDQWIIAGEYSQILLVMISLSFISNSLSGVLTITNKLNISFYWQIYYFFIILLSLSVGSIVFNSVKMTLICYSIGLSSAYILQIYLSYRYSIRYEKKSN